MVRHEQPLESAATSLMTPSKDESLSAAELDLPAYKPSSVQLDYNAPPDSSLPSWNRPRHSSAATDVYDVPVSFARVLTAENAVKKTLELTLDVSNVDIEFEPGDSIGVICKNDVSEVDALLRRLDLLAKRDTPCKVRVKKAEIATDKVTNLPKHIPSTRTSLFVLFSEHCDIRALPKKSLLRILSEHTTDTGQKRRLQEISSRQGSKDYADFVVGSKISLLDVLRSFPSCLPPIECLIENLPALQPRAYSIINSPLVDANCLKFAFNLIDIGAGNGRMYDRHGVCSKFMDDLAKPIQKNDRGDIESLDEGFGHLSIATPTISFFMRKFNTFHLPEDASKPLILIGPGTGIAPFIGFLEHRSFLMKNRTSDADIFGQVLLFYGCRHKDRDFLYRDELETFERDGVLAKLSVCFSRDELDTTQSSCPPLRHVQDCLRRNAADVYRMIRDERAVVFVCGDAKGMARDVYEAFIDVVQTRGGLNNVDARSYLSFLQEEKRYLQDIWT